MRSQKIQRFFLIFSCPVHSLEIETKASFKPRITTDQREKAKAIQEMETDQISEVIISYKYFLKLTNSQLVYILLKKP